MAQLNKKGPDMQSGWWILGCILCLGWVSVPAAAQQRSVLAEHGVVVSVDALASKAGTSILKQGGNAVDAAVATALVLAVTYPQAGNIGGGGFMLIRMADGEMAAVDYREKAPAASSARMFLRKDGTVDPGSSEVGYLVAGVPGTLRGLEAAWKKFGRLPWADLVAPAVSLAEDGFPLPAFEAGVLNQYRRELGQFDATRRIFCKADGSPYAAGDRLVQKDLAATLRIIAARGASDFYEGELAEKVAADMARHGGVMTVDDLRAYQAVIRKPVTGTYRNRTIIGVPPPSAGGITLIEMLNILERFDIRPNDAGSLHRIIEAMRRAYFDRARYLGDADFTSVPSDSLIDKTYAAALAAQIQSGKATRSIDLGPAAASFKEDLETTHFSIVDEEGNVVANTFTLEDNFGSKAVVSGLGFLLNNEMHDFNIDPDRPNLKGWVGFNPNRIEPGKRMLSSMSPTVVLQDGKPLLITGSPGGRTITNTVLQIVVGMLDYHLALRQAVDLPRLNHMWLPDRTTLEANRWDQMLVDSLQAMGHYLEFTAFLGDAHCIWIDPATGQYDGEADYRRMGWAEGY